MQIKRIKAREESFVSLLNDMKLSADDDAANQLSGNDATEAIVCSAICIPVNSSADPDGSGRDDRAPSAPETRLSYPRA